MGPRNVAGVETPCFFLGQDADELVHLDCVRSCGTARSNFPRRIERTRGTESIGRKAAGGDG